MTSSYALLSLLVVALYGVTGKSITV